MYHLPLPKKHYKKAFLEAFAKENNLESDPFRHWRHFRNKHKHESSGKYYVDSLASPYCYVGDMMCRLWGQHDSTKFTIDIVPLMEVAIQGYVMDWENILYDRIATEILEFRRKTYATSQNISRFYYSAYILDIICFNSKYPVLRWK